jgi:sterol desaturase/sphingolipid hydroxylase (fatty acid hydroxylase superfamily)
LTVYPGILLSDFLRYFLVAGAAFLIFWVLARQRLRHRFIQRKFPKAKRLWYEFRYSLSTVFIFSLSGLGIYWAKESGYTQIYSDFATYGWGYFVISLFMMLLFHDAYFYWTHRLMHHPRIYRYVHKVHHMSTNPSPWAAYSFHPYEAIVQAFSFVLMVFLLPLHPLTLFIFLAYMITRDVLGHLGFELFPKGFTRNKWLSWHTTTTHHSLHHEYFNYNYGLYFSWWDNLMKTTHPEYDQAFEEVKARRKEDVAH